MKWVWRKKVIENIEGRRKLEEENFQKEFLLDILLDNLSLRLMKVFLYIWYV